MLAAAATEVHHRGARLPRCDERSQQRRLTRTSEYAAGRHGGRVEERALTCEEDERRGDEPPVLADLGDDHAALPGHAPERLPVPGTPPCRLGEARLVVAPRRPA